MPTAPRCFEEHTSDVGVTCLRDGSLSTLCAAGVLARNDTAVRHQLLRGLEASEAPDLDGYRRCDQLSDAPQCLQPIDHRAHRRGRILDGVVDRLLKASDALA